MYKSGRAGFRESLPLREAMHSFMAGVPIFTRFRLSARCRMAPHNGGVLVGIIHSFMAGVPVYMVALFLSFSMSVKTGSGSRSSSVGKGRFEQQHILMTHKSMRLRRTAAPAPM